VIGGTAAGRRVEFDLDQLLRRRAVVRGNGLRARSIEEKATAVAAFANFVVPLLAHGRIASLVDSVFLLEQICIALDHIAAPGNSGRF
jgi:NADPH:quinone reductase-like Zn-dependent oxidoreductase